MSYVIYKPSVGFHGVTRQSDKEKVENAPLLGTVFERDTQRVHKIIQELTLDTPAQDWIKGIDCGREAMEALQTHFDGEAEGQRRKAQAHADLDSLFYRNEQSFSFEKFATKLKSCFDVLERYKVPKHEEEKVKLLLQKIQTSSYELKTEISICRNNHGNTFEEAVTYLQTGISRIFPQHNPTGRRRRQINATGRGGRFGGRGGRGRGRGGRGRGGGGRGGRGRGGNGDGERKFENGVDITDFTRFFHDDEWNKLSYETRDKIHACPERAKAIEERKNKRRKTNAASTSSISGASIAQIITGVHNAMTGGGEGSAALTPTNGSRVVSAAGRNSGGSQRQSPLPGEDMSQVTFDEYGNRR